LAIYRAVLKEIEIVAPFLAHETHQTRKHNPAFHAPRPREYSFDVLLECWDISGQSITASICDLQAKLNGSRSASVGDSAEAAGKW